MGSKGGYSSRELTQEEKDYYKLSGEALNRASEISASQFGLSNEDRAYFDRLARGAANPNDPAVKQAVAEALEKAQADIDAGKAVVKATPLSYDQWYKQQSEEYSKALSSSDYLEGIAPQKPTEKEYTQYKTGVEATTKIVSGLLSDTEKTDITKSVIESFRDPSKDINNSLFDAIKGSKTETALAITDWAAKTQEAGKKYGTDISGIASKYSQDLTNLAGSYEQKLNTVAQDYKADASAATSKYGNYVGSAIGSFEKLTQEAITKAGTAEQDILSQQRGQALAGISQSYQEAQKQLLGTLSQRGLAGTGVEAGVLTQLSQAQAQTSASALSQSYNTAIALSDQRRQQAVGVGGQLLTQQQAFGSTQLQAGMGVAQTQAGLGTQAAQGAYSSGLTAAQGSYQANMGVAQEIYNREQAQAAAEMQAKTGATQQNIANLQLGSGVSQGVYGGAANYLAQAGNTAVNTGQAAGGIAGTIGNQNIQYAQMQAQQSSSLTSGIGSLVGMAAGGYLGSAAGSAAVTNLFK